MIHRIKTKFLSRRLHSTLSEQGELVKAGELEHPGQGPRLSEDLEACSLSSRGDGEGILVDSLLDSVVGFG